MPDFTPAQESAIQWRKQDACVVAGPGSGKTTVLVERYRSLVEDRNFDVNEILAITFTEKAAANMKAKLADKFRHNPIRLREFDSAWVSTIHGFCARLLRENAIAAGIDPGFRVLDARESDDLQRECINASLDELVELRREQALDLIYMLQDPRLSGDLKCVYDAIRSAGMAIEEVRAMPSPLPPARSSAELARRIVANVKLWPFKLSPTQTEHRPELLAWAPLFAQADSLPFPELSRFLHKPPINLRRVPKDSKDELEAIREEEITLLLAHAVDRHTAPYRSLIFDALARFHALYNERKAALAALDFNDLERHAIDLLKNNTAVQTQIRGKFRQIMLDEFQDVNRQQNQLIDLIRGDDNFFAVGDSNQSIYGFRHARPEIFREYRTRIEAAGKHTADLEHNFRSRPDILSCVKHMLKAAPGIEPRDLIAGKSFDAKAGPSVEILRVLSGGDEDDAAAAEDEKQSESNREARWIAHRILELQKTSGFDFRHFAVLCRNGESMKPILGEFDVRRIPYVCGRRQSFLASREGRNIVAFLRTLANPLDSISLATVLRSDLIGLGDESLLRIRLLAKTLTAGLNMLAFDDRHFAGFAADDAARLRRFNTNLKRWRADLQTVPLDVLISRMLSGCGFAWDPGTSEGDNVEAFLHLARTRGANRPLLEFLRDLESIEDGLNTESDLSDEDQGNCVQVMTAHAAKGLEFPVTIIAAMQKGARQGTSAVSFTPENGIGIKWKDPLNEREGLKDSWARANSDTLKKRESDESERLLYVAMTRAEQHLILSYTRGNNRPSNWAKMLDAYFDLDGEPASRDPKTLTQDGFDASLFVPDFDPPEEEPIARGPTAADITVVPRPQPADQFDTAVNVTSLAVFAKCPRQYYLDRYLGWSPAQPAAIGGENSSGGAELGSEVHEILAGKPGDHSAEARQLADVFLQGELGRRAAASPRSAREWDFIADIEGSLVSGSVDLWFEENDRLHIVDYKTDRAVRTDEYAPQLALYALAMEKAFAKRPAAAWLHFLRPDVIQEVPLDTNRARSLIGRLRDAQNTLTFDVNPGGHCRSCPFYLSMCPAG